MEIKNKKPVDISQQVINELEAIDEADKATIEIKEKDIDERHFPLRWNEEKRDYEWDEEEVRAFYEDPANVSRTVYCPEVNVDLLDDWGMFGFEPGFIFIEKVNYKGSVTLADKAASLGLSMAVDPKTGLGVISHYDYFPKRKFDHQIIRKSDYHGLFNVLGDIFTRKRLRDGGDQPKMLPE